MKSGYVAVVGLPNAGKSTLVNALIGEKVSIVTSKPQTTRKRTLGVLNKPKEYQMVFVDTPGVTDSKDGLNPYLRRELVSAIEEVDVILAVVAPWEWKSDAKPWAFEMLSRYEGEKPVVFCATQIARIPREKRVPLVEKWKSWAGETPLIFSSALEGNGLEDVIAGLTQYMKEGVAHYEEDIYTPQSMREIAAEVVRERCFEFLHQEIPYGLAIQIQKFEEKPNIFKIAADIIVEKDSHKGMVIGKGGQSLKRIGSNAREELEKIFEQKVYLELHVIVRPGWTQSPGQLEELGYTHV